MRHRQPARIAGLCLALLAISFTAAAGYDEAQAAYLKKDYETALREARLAAEAGDLRASWLLGNMLEAGQGVAMNKTEALEWYQKAAAGGLPQARSRLMWLYARGEGVPRDPQKALHYAREGDRLGDRASSHFVYVLLTTGPLGWLDAQGKPDQARYRVLAARPVSERALDTEAYDALYRSAARGHAPALFSLALVAGATVGEGNRTRMLSALGRLPTWNHPALKRHEQVARLQERLGPSLASPQLFLDAQLPQAVAGMIATCGVRDPKETPTPAALPELIRTAISRPLGADAVWLPSQVPGHEHAYLISGQWEETWTYRGCERTADVIIEFTADGLGGASFRSRQTVRAATPAPAAPNQP